MAFQVSPSILVKEVDQSTFVASVSTSNAGLVGAFAWGPVEEIVQVNSEAQLVSLFGKPSSSVYKDFMCASSFLSYASNLQLVRVVGSGALNATATVSGAGSGLLIKNLDTYNAYDYSATTILWNAKSPGTLGNSLQVAWADTAGFDDLDSNGEHTWPYADLFTSAPASAEYHIVVIDEDGTITGTADTILEKFAFVSTTSTAIAFDGTSSYFKNVINKGSAWLWVGKASLLTSTHNGVSLGAGADGSAISAGNRQTGMDIFADPESVDVSLVLAGGADTTAATYLITDLAEVRKDCVAFVSVQESDVVGIFNSATVLTNIKATRASLGSSSYAVMDSAYKLMYDRYNDVNRWVPLNGDIAGLCAATDLSADPWFSPAGFNRGRIKNAIKLSNAQPKDIRDTLYNTGVNPCVVFPLEGPVLFGDKTLLSVPSAFDRINVRRLFIVLEKAIANSAKAFLFENNTAHTRARFVNMVEPFLRDVQGRQGIEKFKVVCDETNNTSAVINANEFVASILIVPTKSINYIVLSFVANSSGTNFEESVVSGSLV